MHSVTQSRVFRLAKHRRGGPDWRLVGAPSLGRDVRERVSVYALAVPCGRFIPQCGACGSRSRCLLARLDAFLLCDHEPDFLADLKLVKVATRQEAQHDAGRIVAQLGGGG
jgi:hypothetical protein